MKPAPFTYCRPGSLTEAVAALAGDPGAKVLAGGQSLVPLLSMRLAAPSMLVDINGLPGLDAITADESGVTIGALARHADVLASRRRTPGAAAGLDGARARRARHHPQPRHHGRLARARRRGRGDAGRAHPARRLARGRGPGRAAHHPRRRALRRPARVERAPRRDRGLGVLPGPRRGRRRGLRRDRPPARRLRAGRRGRARRGRLGQGRLPLGGRRPDRGRPLRRTRRPARRRRARAARAGRRHPRHRRLPRPAGARPDRPRGSIGAGGGAGA